MKVERPGRRAEVGRNCDPRDVRGTRAWRKSEIRETFPRDRLADRRCPRAACLSTNSVGDGPVNHRGVAWSEPPGGGVVGAWSRSSACAILAEVPARPSENRAGGNAARARRGCPGTRCERALVAAGYEGVEDRSGGIARVSAHLMPDTHRGPTTAATLRSIRIP